MNDNDYLKLQGVPLGAIKVAGEIDGHLEKLMAEGARPQDAFNGLALVMGRFLNHWPPSEAAAWLKNQANQIERIAPTWETEQ